MRTRRLLLALAALCTVAAACGSDEGGAGEGEGDPQGLTEAEQEYADAWSATLQDDEDGFGAEPEDADCMGAAIMQELGTDPFEEADVAATDIDASATENSPGELLGEGTISDAQADAILDTWDEDCIELAELLGQSAGGEFDLDPEGAACFQEGLGEGDVAKQLLRPSFTSSSDDPDQETVSAMLALLDECGDGAGSTIASSIAEELAADGTITEEQAQCIAQAVLDDIGAERLAEISAGGEFEDADPAVQQELTGSLLEAAGTCNVPVSAFGG